MTNSPNRIRPRATPTRPLSVAIAGAGPGGSALAVILARAGIEVVLLERTVSSGPMGTGILLQPNGLAVLDAIGVAAALHADGHLSTSVDVRDQRGRAIIESQIPDFGNGLDHVLAVRRSALLRGLDAAVAAESRIHVVRGATVLSASREGSATVREPGGTRTYQADVIVGADGTRSAVRTSGNFGVISETKTHTYIRGVVESASPALVQQAETGEVWTKLGLFGCSPIGAEAVYFYADAEHASVARAIEDRDLHRLASRWGSVLPLASALFDAVGDVGRLLVTQTSSVTCERWVDGRVVLLGDAAHAMEPTLGQGANTALVDAAVLAAALTTSTDVDQALATYEQVRRHAVSDVQTAAHRIARLAAVRSGLGGAIRNGIVRRLSSPAATARHLRQAQQVPPQELLQMVRSTNGQPLSPENQVEVSTQAHRVLTADNHGHPTRTDS